MSDNNNNTQEKSYNPFRNKIQNPKKVEILNPENPPQDTHLYVDQDGNHINPIKIGTAKLQDNENADIKYTEEQTKTERLAHRLQNEDLKYHDNNQNDIYRHKIANIANAQAVLGVRFKEMDICNNQKGEYCRGFLTALEYHSAYNLIVYAPTKICWAVRVLTENQTNECLKLFTDKQIDSYDNAEIVYYKPYSSVLMLLKHCPECGGDLTFTEIERKVDVVPVADADKNE